MSAQNESECKCYICGKPMSLADWYDTPCCMRHITDQLKAIPNPKEEVYEAFLHGTVQNPLPPNPSFSVEAFEELVEYLKNIKKKEYMYITSSDEVAEELKSLLPFADIRLIPKAATFKDKDTDEVVYVIPAEPKPVKVVFEHKTPGEDWENWGY